MTPVFPAQQDFAEAFFREAVRHLTDACHLHSASRSAASITSSMKAAELSIKAVIILENAMGMYDKTFSTHKPLKEVESHPLLKRLIDALEGHRNNLSVEIRALESLEPTQFGKRQFEAAEANTEYPYLIKTTDAAGNTVGDIQRPEDYFTLQVSLNYYRLARELLTALPALYPAMSSWGVVLSDPL